MKYRHRTLHSFTLLVVMAGSSDQLCSIGFVSEKLMGQGSTMCCPMSCSEGCSLMCPRAVLAADRVEQQKKNVAGVIAHTQSTPASSKPQRAPPLRTMEHECCGAKHVCKNSSQTSCIVVPQSMPPVAMSGKDRASLFSRCNRSAVSRSAHFTDTVISLDNNFVYLDNVKSGSAVITARLKHSTYATVTNPLGERFQKHKGRDCFSAIYGRSTTQCILSSDLSSLFFFSVVRDPVEKFESGVRQAWSQSSHLRGLSADALLQKQLSGSSEDELSNERSIIWINEHLQPSSWRLSGRIRGNQNLNLTFIGALETIVADWPEIVKRFVNLDHKQSASLLEPLELEHSSSRFVNSKGKSSLLSDDGIRQMCNSELYGSEWRCLGYPLPHVCREPQ